MARFQGQVVLITGASSGIGAALAREFAAEGAGVVLTARRRDRLEALASELEGRGSRALALTCDVTAEEDLAEVVKKIEEEFGRLDVVVANAGFGVIGRFEKLSLPDYRRQFDTNVFGVLRTAKEAFPALKKSRGRFVIIGSVSGHISAPEASAYSMSKYAVRALAEALYAEWAPSGVSVTLISPGFVATEIQNVDNQGHYREHGKARVPAWIKMSAQKAAKQIVRAVAGRKREKVITLHGKLFVVLDQFFPGLMPRFFRRLGKRVRRGS